MPRAILSEAVWKFPVSPRGGCQRGFSDSFSSIKHNNSFSCPVLHRPIFLFAILPIFLFAILSVLWSAGPVRGEFLCTGNAVEPAPAGKAAVKTTGSLSALVIFAKFRNETRVSNEAPSWAQDLFDRSRPGSFAHFYDEMSRGQLRVEGQVLTRRYTSLQAASAYVAETPRGRGKFAQFNLEILDQVDRDVDLGQFDNDGPDRIPNSGDDDGYVDIVFINLNSRPEGFFIGTATGLASLGLDADYISNDPAASGATIRIRSRFKGFGGTTQQGHVFPLVAGTLCHEFAHVLGLPDLFDQSYWDKDNEPDPELDSAGIGRWGLMGLGTQGWIVDNVEDGPNAFCAWSLAKLGWVGVDNENLVEVTESMRDMVIEDIDRGGKVFKIPVSQDEYFMLENRQRTGSYYDRNIPGEGLLIWHVDERADNDEERHKQVDLVCADGLYLDRGFPGGQPDPVRGGDNLDFRSRDVAYQAAHNGNEGDATDPFDGVRFTRFAYDTNPRPSAHTGFSRNLPVGLVVDNIRADGDRIIADILLRQPLEGHIRTDTTWSGQVEVDGDVVVERGAALRVAGGTTVHFAARRDSRQSGFDPNLSELLVFGDLVLEGASGPLRFISAAARPRAQDWSGIYLLNGQNPNLERVTIANARHGLVRSHLPPGTTRWSGRQVIRRDLVVPANAELVVESGTRVGFTSADMSGGGYDPTRTELIVEGGLTVEGSTGHEVVFTLNTGRSDSLWFGVYLEPGAQVQARFLQIEQSVGGFIGEVSEASSLRLEDGLLQRTGGGGLRLMINGQVEVDRTTFASHAPWGIRVQGNGRLLLRNVALENNGWEGLFLVNCSLEAIATRIHDNGKVDSENRRSGLQAVGGRGQKIEMWNCAITGNGVHGLDLDSWEGVLELHHSEISGNKANGLQAAGLERVIFEDMQVARNLGAGATIEDAPVEIWTTTFADNIGTGLILKAGASGIIDMSHFRGNAGVLLKGIHALIVRRSDFENTPLGLSSENSRPTLRENIFANNLLALKVTGNRVPMTITQNIFVGNHTAVENLSPLSLPAQDNYWGTADSTAIDTLIEGLVDWMPFLEKEPGQTVVEGESNARPTRFALHASFPNPFNAQTTIRYDLPRPVAVELIIYDILGRLVRQWQWDRSEPGSHRQVWDGRDQGGRAMATGVYFYQLRAGEFKETSRLLLLQ